MSRNRFRVLSIVVGLLSSQSVIAQTSRKTVSYEVSFPSRAQHEARVTVVFSGVPKGKTLEARMARSSPGRYAMTSFAKNVYDVTATDGKGRSLIITRPDTHGWNVKGHDGTVRISYTVFGNRADGTYLQVDTTHAHMNMPATFMFAHGFDNAQARLRIAPPDNWKIATQLVPTSDPNTFTAPNMQWFMDSPTEVGPLMFNSWSETINGKTSTWRIAMHHQGTQAQLDSFAPMVRRVVDEEIKVFGEPAGYDFGTYTFLIDFGPWATGDGMEHRNSTFITSSRSNLSDSVHRARALSTVAHEFFHSWNMERIRSRDIEPFDFDRENMSRDLWFGEGFTEYYGELMLKRAGFMSDSAFNEIMRGAVDEVTSSPARQHHSAVEMSMQAPFFDGASFLDPVNTNIFISYYTWGEVIALSLDQTLRAKYNLTLDDYMRAVWRDYGSHQSRNLAPSRPYTTADLRAELAKVTKDSAFANDFFRRYVEGREVMKPNPALSIKTQYP